MPYAVWQFPGPGSGDAFAESRRGLSPEQEDAIYFGERLPEPLPDVETGPLSEGRIGHVIGTSFSALVVSPAVRALLDPAARPSFTWRNCRGRSWSAPICAPGSRHWTEPASSSR